MRIGKATKTFSEQRTIDLNDISRKAIEDAIINYIKRIKELDLSQPKKSSSVNNYINI